MMPSRPRSLRFLPRLFLLGILTLAAATPGAAAEAGSNDLAAWREALDATRLSERLGAVRELVRLRPEGTVDLLGEYVQDRHPMLRRSVLQALATLGGPRALSHLDRALALPDPAIRVETVRALGRWSGPEAQAVERLVARARDEDPDVAIAAVQGLTERDASAHTVLFMSLLSSPDDILVTAAMNGLREARHAPAVPALARLAEGPSLPARDGAVEALATIGGAEAVAALVGLSAKDRDPKLRHAAVHALGLTSGALGSGRLAEIADARDPSTGRPVEEEGLRVLALDSLRKQGTDAARPFAARILSLLGDGGSPVRMAALRLVRDLSLDDGRDAVLAIASRTTAAAEERGLALRCLAVLDADAAIRVSTALGPDDDPLLRLESVEVLGRFADRPAARRALLGLVGDREPALRDLALQQLPGHAGPDDVPVLAEAAASEDLGVRVAVATVLGATGAPGALPPLLGLLADGEPAVRRSAAEALGNLGMPEAREALTERRRDPDPGVRSAVREALGRLGPPS